MPKHKAHMKPDTRRAKSVLIQPTQRDTLNDAVDYLIEQLTFQSASQTIEGFARRLAMKHLRSLQRAVGE